MNNLNKGSSPTGFGSRKNSKKQEIHPASFCKDRSKKVSLFIRNLRTQIKACSGDASKKRQLQNKLAKVCYFDQPSTRRCLIKAALAMEASHGRLETKRLLSWYISLYEKRAMDQGPVAALKLLKELYGYACRYSSSNIAPAIKYLKSDPSGFPKILKPLKPYLRGHLLDRKLALAVLSLFRVVEAHDYGKAFDSGLIGKYPLSKTSPLTEDFVEIGTYFREAFESIKDGQPVKDKLPNDFKIKRWISVYRVVLERMFPSRFTKRRLDTIMQNSCLHFSGRNGPNGPALLTIMQDYQAIKPTALLNNIKELATLTNNSQLLQLMGKLESSVITVDPNPPKDVPKQKEVIHSKISLKEESWGRLRPFAICDYFSHSALRGFHEYLFDTLRNYKEDCTFEQEKGSNAIRLWTTFQIEIESADLSEATNVIPLLIQREMVQKMTSSRFGYLWANIVGDREFKTPDGSYIRYNCGQPMGISSSWPMLAMWHHVIARTCLSYLGLSWGGKQDTPQYYIIGDDIAMKSRMLFHIYESAVAILQDVGVSKTKGFHTETQNLENCLPGESFMSTAEFAKRIFCNGMEITPVPPAEIFEYITHPYLLPNLVQSYDKRDYGLNTNQVKILAEVSNDPRLALDCLCAPHALGPDEGNLVNVVEPLVSDSIWGSDNSDELLDLLMEEIQELATSAINSATAELVAWANICRDSKIAVQVRSWSILGEGYSYLFQQLSQLLGGRYSMKYAEIFSEYEGLTPENWKGFFRSLGNLQTVWDIAEQLKRVNSVRPKMKKHIFTASILAKAIKTVRKNALS